MSVKVSRALSSLLEDFKALEPNDGVQRDKNLVHMQCGERLATVEDGDTIAVLVDVCADHVCGDGEPGYAVPEGR
jgi:hypothetical protein